MSKQPAMPNTYATFLSGQGKPVPGSIGHFVFGNSGVRVWEYETSSSGTGDILDCFARNRSIEQSAKRIVYSVIWHEAMCHLASRVQKRP